MPRYYFDLRGNNPCQDYIGTELPDDAAAWREAVRFARDLESRLRPGDSWSLEVVDGSPVYRITLTTQKLR